MLDGMKPFTKEERFVLQQLKNKRRLIDPGAKVKVTTTDSARMKDESKSWIGTVVRKRDYVFFTIGDSIGNESEHHLFELQFLQKDTRRIITRRPTR